MARKSVYRNTALKATAQLVSGGAGEITGWHIANEDSVATYLHFYDSATAGAVTVGTTTPKLSWKIPADAVLHDHLGLEQLTESLPFDLGIVVAATTTVGGAVAPTNGLLVDLLYI